MVRLPQGALTPPQEILHALKQIDPGLFPVFAEWRINPKTGTPVVHPLLKGPIYEPRWHLYFFNKEQQKYYYLFPHEDKEKGFLPLDMRVVKRLAGDLGRQGLSADQIDGLLSSAEKAKDQALRETYEDLQTEFFKANKKKLQYAFEHPEEIVNNVRETKTISYEGMDKHTSSAEKEKIEKTPEELGWEMVDWDKELGNKK